jgi:hypothetical protein
VSRYTVPCDTFGPEAGEAVVGWDARRRTYFAQTYDYAATGDSATHAIGLTPGEIPTVVDLIRESYAFCEIDDDTIAALLDDPALEAAGHPPRVGTQPLGPDQGFPAAAPPPRP